MHRQLLLCLALLLTCLGAQADISARLDRQTATLGDTLTLTISATEGDDIGQPDLSPLAGDFRVLSQSSSSHISLVNGDFRSTETLRIFLRPTHPGQLTIPALQAADGKTQPIHVTIKRRTASNTPAAQQHLFVQAELNPKTVYLGQQATLDVKLYYDIDLNKGSLQKPKVEGASVQPLGKPQEYISLLNGKRYQVYRQRFAILPHQSGQLSIPSVVFQGQKLSTSSRNFFGMTIRGFGHSEPVSAASAPTQLTVKPIPSSWSGIWLPASDLKLSISGLPENQPLRVGEPLRLTLTLKATGLPASSLPELSLPPLKGAKVYADKPVTHTSQSGQLFHAQLSRSFTILPQQAGRLTLPATQLAWFDTDSAQKQVAKLAAREFQVLPAAASASTSTTTTQATAADSPHSRSAQPEEASQAAIEAESGSYWQLAFWFSLGLWLLLLLGWLWQHLRRKSTPAKPQVTPSRWQKTLLRQLAKQDPALLTSLQAWAKEERPSISSLAQLKAQLVAEQRVAIEQLEAWRYGVDIPFPSGTKNVFSEGLKWRQDDKQTSPLEPLYPSR